MRTHSAHALETQDGLSVEIVQGDFSEQSGEAAIEALLKSGHEFDAVFAANDMMAIGALQALRQAGIRVPEDVAVVGFDDVPLARHLGLTTVRVRIAELGERALDRLVSMLAGADDRRAGTPPAEARDPFNHRPKALYPLIFLDRRSLLRNSSLLIAGSALPACTSVQYPSIGRTLPAFYEDIEQRTFRFFWDTVNRKNGLVPDRWPTPAFCSIAAVGFALTAYAIGVERGWCSRAEARDRTLTTLRFFWNAPQGPEPTRHHRPQGLLLPLPRHADGASLIARSSCRASTRPPAARHPVRGAVFRPATMRPSARSAGSRTHIYARADWNLFRTDGRSADLDGLASGDAA